MAGIFRKIFGGFSHGHSKKEERSEKQPTPEKKTPVVPTQQQRAGGGFSVKVAVPADPVVYAPVVTQCNGNGGVQGLTWYAKELRADDDGDVAQEFLREVVPETRDVNATTPPCFEAVRHTRPVKLKGPVCTQDGNVHIS
ncbi:hypothetical protein M758_4G149500 [Ceratodon purpureus]|uniref:Uncharacterized protein n=1 Tax=Ceratodon purpureus TaxID=3225 RepID=A0A8T0IB36_CERPU|nr:hypothetical protein KC19_4G147900 [Ceratodon purpureus]KAG0619578.1 hypothetical protein M758_4G149500 [Ceratodon purpureus]